MLPYSTVPACCSYYVLQLCHLRSYSSARHPRRLLSSRRPMTERSRSSLIHILLEGRKRLRVKFLKQGTSGVVEILRLARLRVPGQNMVVASDDMASDAIVSVRLKQTKLTDYHQLVASIDLKKARRLITARENSINSVKTKLAKMKP
jgi:hypothetical protein